MRLRLKATSLWIALVLLWVPVCAMADALATAAASEDAMEARIAQARIEHTVSYLSSLGSRVAGYPGCDLAATFIEEQFRQIGLEQVRREPFDVVAPIDHGAHLELTASGERFELHALWPNGVRTPTTGPPGYAGALTYGGTGMWSELDGHELEGRVVLLEFNSARRWLDMAALGARAIIFIAPAATSPRQAVEKQVYAPLDVPRFWIDRRAGIELRQRLVESELSGVGAPELAVELHGRMDWESRTTWNIIGTLRGSDPELSAQTIVLQAYYDGTSVAPARAPAAEATASTAALLELARSLQQQRPARSIIFVATSAHFQARQGIIDFVRRHARRHSTYAEQLPEALDFDLFIGLDLSTGSDQLGLWNNVYDTRLTRFFSPFGRLFMEHGGAVARQQGRDPATALVNGISPVKGFTWSSYMPGGLRTDSQILFSAGFPALTFATVNDARLVLDTPLDDGTHLHLANLERQIVLLKQLLPRVFAERELLAPAADLRAAIRDELRDMRIHTRGFPRRSQTPDRPLENTLVTLRQKHWVVKGVRPTRVYLTDSSGEIEVPALRLGTWETDAFGLDVLTGAITFATDLGLRTVEHHGKPMYLGYLHYDVRWDKTVDRTVVLFPTMAQEIYSLLHPGSLDRPNELRIVDDSGVPPRQYGYTVDDNVAVLFGAADPEEKDRLKILLEDMPLLNNSGTQSAEEALGRGYLPTDGPLTHLTQRAALDLWRIDEYRLDSMREHAIESAPIQRLHDQAWEQIQQAEDAREALQWDRYVEFSRAGLGIESRAYPRIVATLNDVIKGLLFFLALLLPAAFFGERLLFAATDIRWQLAGFGGLMLVIWGILSLVHPAFHLAHPLVILLAFSIMAMALFVISMVASRFNLYAAEYRSQVAQVHNADFNRVGAAYVAFMLGVSNMRRRKLRTGLTLVTLTLLTFSMLSFSSFQEGIRFVSLRLSNEAVREGVLLRKPTWSGLSLSMLDHVGSHFGRTGVVSPRLWYRASSAESVESTSVRSGERQTTAADMVGFMPQEDDVTQFSSTLMAGSFFEDADEQSCLLSEKMANALGIAAQDVGSASVSVLGSDLLVRGIFHPEAVDELKDLDAGTLMPIDVRLSSFAEIEENWDDLGETVDNALEVRAFIHLPASDVLILPYEVLRGLGGQLRSIGIRFNEDADGRPLIEDFLSRVNIGLYAGLAPPGSHPPDVYHYRSIGLGSMEGMGALVVPIVIASLIVLNTMLGAVYERFREIGIYSSVGLAPVHISFLFLAEACVYAVVGVTLGYVLGQTLGKILLSLDLLQGIDLNYSSSSGIAAALLVMLVVLVSTLYPARVAARAAVPDTVRRWRPPAPAGDAWSFAFPFNVSESEIQGTSGFLYSYFASFMGAAAGDIYTDELRLSSGYALEFKQWLTPYDLGVSQRVRIEFAPTQTRGLYSIEILIRRVSGESFHWRRLNPHFFSMLRKQLLIWNTLDLESRKSHATTAAELMHSAESAAETGAELETLEPEALPGQPEPVAADAGQSPFSVRGILLGTLLCLFIGAGATYGSFVLQGSLMTANASSPAAIFLFVMVTTILNVTLGLIRKRFALSRADLVLIYFMMLMAVTIPNMSFVGYLIPLISGGFYYATEQNEWATLFLQYLPEWMVPQDMAAITQLYEGLVPGGSIPWGAWIGPLGYWYLFFLALSLLMVCLSVILHRQWSVHERLDYPMAQVPLAMIEQGAGPLEQLAPLYRNKWTWIGFAVPAVVLSLDALSFHVPSFPVSSLSYNTLIAFFGGAMVLNFGIHYAWIGFTYLINLDVSLSIWVFFLLSKLQDVAFTTFGIAPTEKLSSYNYLTTADLCHQGMGACVAFVFYALWVGRRHLRDVLRKAWRPNEGIDDSEELISYRTAVIGFVLSLSFVGLWLWKSGIPLLVLPLFLATCLLFYIMISRVIATTGIATARSPMVAAFVLISGLGSSVIGAQGLAALAMTYSWQAEMRIFPMIACANGLKLAETVRGPKKRLFWAIGIALVASLAGATFVFLYSAYTHGGINLDTFFTTGLAKRPFLDFTSTAKDLSGPDWRGWGFTGFGLTVESFLIYAQHHFHWWRLHPLGFVIGSGWLTGTLWFSVFLGWLVKFIIMKYGGMSHFLAAKPFFIGMILGQATTAGLWLIVDTLLGGVGNEISIM